MEVARLYFVSPAAVAAGIEAMLAGQPDAGLDTPAAVAAATGAEPALACPAAAMVVAAP